jgi:hypothetical protein
MVAYDEHGMIVGGVYLHCPRMKDLTVKSVLSSFFGDVVVMGLDELGHWVGAENTRLSSSKKSTLAKRACGLAENWAARFVDDSVQPRGP